VAVIFSLTVVLVGGAVRAKNEKTENPKKISAQERQEIKRELKNFEKAERKSAKEDKEPQALEGKSNAQLHKMNIETFVESLEDIIEEETIGDSGVAEEIEELAENEEEIQERVTDAIIAVENRNKYKRILLGTDYKNLGQLRQNLVHNRNQIRKFNRVMENVEAGGEREPLEQQLRVLVQERQRIRAVIQENEGGFSILGWVFKLLYGYSEELIDEEAEEELLEEVTEVIGGEEENGEAIEE